MQQRVAEGAVRSSTSQEVKDRMVTVVCGTHEVADTYAGHTVAQVRTELAETLRIPEGAVAIMGGPVPRDQEQITLLVPGKSLEFVQRTGTKG